MALEKTETVDKIEIKGEYKHLQIRKKISVLEDGSLLSSSYHAYVVSPGDDVTNEPQEIKDLVNLLHTDSILSSYQEYMTSLLPPDEGEDTPEGGA
jgi:hypothetical protein